MAIKRKTHLNLSGSHHTLDSDNAFVGGIVYATGSVSASIDVSAQGNLYVQGATQLTGAVNLASTLSSSGDLSTQGILRVQGATQLTGAVNLASSLSASGTLNVGGASFFKAGTFTGALSSSNALATATNLQVGQNAFVTGSLQVTGSIFVAAASLISASVVSASVGVSASVLQGTTVTAADTISGSIGRFTYLSGALSASSTGLPFIVAGSGVTTNFSHTDLNWTIAATGGGGSVAGSDTQVQFNQNGAFAASSSLTHFSGTLGVQALSGSLTSSGTVLDTFQYNGNILKITSNVLVTQSVMVFEGTDPTVEVGGVILTNGAQLSMYSGSATGPNSPLAISPAVAADSVDVNVKGSVTVKSGSLAVNSGSASDSSFTVEPSTTAGQVNVIFDRTGSTGGVNFAGINVRPLYSFQDDTAGSGFIMPGDLLSAGTAGNNSIGKIDFNIIAVSKDSDNYASWTFSTTVAKNIAGTTVLVGVPTELDSATSGSAAATWDVNVNDNATIACTGSALATTNPIKWYAQITKKMFVSGSGLITY